MEKKYYTKKQILERKKILNEDGVENALMIAGFVPVIGEIADIVLIARYIYQKQYLYAGLMLIALIPTVGDFIVKPIIKLLKTPMGKGALRNTDTLVEFATKNPEFAKKYVQIGKYLKSPSVTKTIENVNKVPVVGSRIGSGLQKSITEHSNAVSRIINRPIEMGKQIGSTIASGGKFSTGFKNFFRGEKLTQYVAKKGKAPSTWLSNWWNVVMPARRGRRNMIKQFIITNGLLDVFGLPSFEKFEEKFQNDENFREQLANNPKFSELVNQTTSEEDLKQIEGDGESSSTSGSLFGGAMSLNYLKTIAQKL